MKKEVILIGLLIWSITGHSQKSDSTFEKFKLIDITDSVILNTPYSNKKFKFVKGNDTINICLKQNKFAGNVFNSLWYLPVVGNIYSFELKKIGYTKLRRFKDIFYTQYDVVDTSHCCLLPNYQTKIPPDLFIKEIAYSNLVDINSCIYELEFLTTLFSLKNN